MKPLFVKICGVTSVDDACFAAEAGTDAIGLNFYRRSPRAVSVAVAKQIVAALPPFVWTVGIFVDESATTLKRIADAVRLDAVQLHGRESPQFVKRLHRRTLKAIHVSSMSVDALAARYETADALVLDAAQPNFGGGGITFDWKFARSVAAQRAILLAGGLTPKNVAEAVRFVQPFGVDVASGVEKAPGVKDAKKVRAFIRAARGAS